MYHKIGSAEPELCDCCGRPRGLICVVVDAMYEWWLCLNCHRNKYPNNR